MGVHLVKDFMSLDPHTIGADQPMAVAHRIMRTDRIRHLPVLSGGRVVGVVSDRDLHLIETLDDVDPAQVTVEEAMTPNPYCTGPETPLEEVVTAMADHKYGCAIILRDNKVAGVFTTVDACRACAELLRALG